MAKPLLLRALKDLFGSVVEGINSENLQIAVWNGEVLLENLSLKPDALDSLDLPLKLVMGNIKSFRITVPWARLSTEPVRITMDGIYALAILKEPAAAAAASAASSSIVSRRQLREKRRKLRWAQLNEEPDPSAEHEPHEEGFLARLLGKVVDNLVVEVRNAHLRIEDPNRWSGRFFAFGCSLRRFLATTCDARGTPAFVDRSESRDALHRIVTCHDLAVYWDSNAPLFSANSLADARIDMHELEFETSSPEHDYLLAPCSPGFVVAKNELPSLTLPRWHFNVNLGGIHVRFTRSQFQDVLGLHLALERHLLHLRPNPRPAVRPGRNPRAWWRYVIARVIQDLRHDRESRDWLALARRVRDRQIYIALYKRTRVAPFLQPLTDADKAKMQELEDRLALSDTLAFRATSLAELAMQRAHSSAASPSPSQPQPQTSWIRGWFGRSASVASTELTKEEKDEIEQALGADFFQATTHSHIPESTLNVVIVFKLKDATLTLVDAASRELLHCLVEGHSTVETCVGSTWRMSFGLESFELTDRFRRDTLFPLLIAPRDETLLPRSVLDVLVEVKPPKQTADAPAADVAINVNVVPFRIVLVPQWVSAVAGFFQVSEEARLGIDGASEALYEWSENKQQDLVEALARRTLIALKIKVAKPIIALPLDSTKHTLPMIILDLSDLELVSDDPRLKGLGNSDDSDVGLALDAWQLELRRVRARLVTPAMVASGNWHRAFDNDEDNAGYLRLLDEFNLQAHLAVCVTPAALQVAKTRLSLSSTELHLHAPPSLLEYASDLGVSWSQVLAGPPAPPVSLDTEEEDLPSASALEEPPALLQINLSVDALIVSFAPRLGSKPLAKVELRRFTAQQIRRPSGDADLVMSLGSVKVSDLFSPSTPLVAQSSERQDSSIISVGIHWTHSSTSVNAKFDELHVHWNPETVAEIKDVYSVLWSGSALQPPKPLTPSSRPRKTVALSASLNALSISLYKGSRILSLVTMANATVSINQDSSRNSWFKAKLGQLLTTQPLTNLALFANHTSQDADALFTIDFTTRVEDSIHDAALSCAIGPATLVYSQQMWMELLDYFNEGVLGAIFLDLSERVDEVVMASRKSGARWLASFDWASPLVIIPTIASGRGDEHVSITCTNIKAFNSFSPPVAPAVKWTMQTEVHLSDASFQSLSDSSVTTTLLVDPVQVLFIITQPIGVENLAFFYRNVAGTVSPIEIVLTRHDYYLLHRVLRGNLLSESPAKSALHTQQQQQQTTTTTQRVRYEYDKDNVPSTPFKIDIDFCTASLKLTDEFDIATFALKQAIVSINRPEINGVVTNRLRVQYIDLVDDRPVSHARCFRHLILCDTSTESKEAAFEVEYIGEKSRVSINLNTFRSAVMVDLFWSVLDFITTTEPPRVLPEENVLIDHAPDISHLPTRSTSPVSITPWHGTFKLRQASMFLLCNLVNPGTDALVMGGDLDLEWRRKDDGSVSSWTGELKRFELYRAVLPFAVSAATPDQSRIALLQPAVGNQVIEPTDTKFSYVYEQDAFGMDTRIHNRHVSVHMEQMEMFMSISDMAAMVAIGRGFGRGDGPAPVQGHDFFRTGPGVKLWSGQRSDMPLNDPTPWYALHARRRLGKQRFTVEVSSAELRAVELVEHEGFVTVAAVPRPCALYQLLAPGDVLVAVDFTPVLQKSPRLVRALMEESLPEALSTVTIHPFGCKDPLVLKDTLEVNGGVVVLHLIDDIHQRDLPLAHLSFSKIDVFVNGSNEGNYVSGAGLLLAMHYHDSITGRWEMLMSPWDAQLSCLWQPHGQIECSFETSKDLQFQLSDVFVRALADAARRAAANFSWNSLPSVKPSLTRPTTQAFLLRNRTGESVSMWLEESPHKATRVGPNEDVSFSFAHVKGEGKGLRREYTQPRTVRVQVGEDNNPLPPITVNVVHRGFVQLVPRLAPHALRGANLRALVKVMWEVALEDGRLVLELRSFRRIKNMLSVPVAVLGRAKGGAGGQREACIVHTGETVALPIALGDVTEVLLRPLTGEEHGWSEPCYVELAAQRGTSQVVCKPQSPVHEPFHLHVRVEVEEEDGVTVRFTVFPPITVCNQLPSPLALAVFAGDRKAAVYPIAPGGALNVHDVAVQGNRSHVCFRLTNSEWTKKIRVDVKKVVLSTPRLDAKPEVEGVESGGRREETVTMTVRDGDGTMVPLTVVQQTTLHEGVKFIVFCAVWLVNKTSLPLAYGYANNWTSTSVGTSAPKGVMLYGPVLDESSSSQGKLQVRLPEGKPSLPIAINVPDGKARVVVVPGGATWPNSFDLAVSVDVGPSVLFRTNIVTLAPRYVFSNLLSGDVSVLVRQLWDDVRPPPRDQPAARIAQPASLTIGPGGKEAFWASSSTSRRPFRIEMGLATSAWNSTWSESFYLERLLEGRAVVLVALERTDSKQVVRFNVEVREDLVAGSISVEIADWAPDEELPVTDAAEPLGEQGEDIKPVFEVPRTKFSMRIPSVVVILRSDRPSKHRTAHTSTFATRSALRRGAVGESREVARASVRRLEGDLSLSRDGRNVYSLKLGEVAVIDPSPPGPLFRVPFEGSPLTEDLGFLELQVAQRAHPSNMVFDKLRLKVARLNMRVDERFVFDVAKYSEDAVFKPLRQQQAPVVVGQEDDCSLFMRNLVENDQWTHSQQAHSLGHLIFFDKFSVSPFEVKLWYQQSDNMTSSLVSFGMLSRLKIRILGQRIRFGALNLRRPFGSSNLYLGIMRAHYESEARSQMGALLVRSINFTDAPFAIAESLISKIVGSEIRSNEFKGESLSNEEFLVRYRRRLSSCQSSDQFLKDVVRNAVFDWSYNHTGLGSRRALIVGIVNRSARHVTVRFQLARGAQAQLLPGGLASRQLGDDGVLVACMTEDGSWDPSTTSLLVAWGVLNDTVDVVLRSDAFTARFDHVKSVLRSEPGFTAAFFAKEVSSWLSWYCLVVDDAM